MSKFGGLQEKIKIINVIKNILDIQTINTYELEIKLEDNPSKDLFVSIATELQRIPFIYDNIIKDLSPTILLRNLLYIPSVCPIISVKKECNSTRCIYTRTPVRKPVLNTDFTSRCVPTEEPLYVVGLAININKQNKILNIRSGPYIIPEYLDTFETEQQYRYIFFDSNNINANTNILIELTRQIRYSVRFYNSTIYEYSFYYYLDNNKEIIDHSKPDSSVTSWYTDKEKEYISFLLKDNRRWIYNLDPLQSLKNIDLLLYINTEGPTSDYIKNYNILQEIDTNRQRELNRIEKNNLYLVNMAKRYIIIINKKLGFNVQQKVLIALSKGKYLRLPGGSMAIPTISTNIVNPLAILNQLTKEQQYIVKIEYEKQEKFMKSKMLNKCPHLEVYYKLIRSKNVNETKSLLNNMTSYFKEGISNGYYMCMSCEYHIMCSHFYDKLRYTIDNLPLNDLNMKLMEYALKIRVDKGYSYYCKYCGEQLIREIFTDDYFNTKMVQKQLTENELEIRNYTWSVIMTVIKPSNFTNEKSLAMYISNTVRPVILAIAQNKFDDNVKFICIVHVLAFILLLIKEHKVSILNIDPNIPVSRIAEKLLLFIVTKYYQLMKILTVNSDMLKNEFMEAYKHILTTGPTDIPANNAESDLANFILNIDPIYKYAKTICRLLGKISFKIDISVQTLRKEFEIILGSSLPSIIKSAKDNIKNPLFNDIINKHFGSALQIDSLEFFYKNPDLNIYNNIISINNEDKVLNKFLDGDYNSYKYACYIMLCKYIRNIHNQFEYDDYKKLFDQFKLVENEMILEMKQLLKKPIYSLKYIKDSHFIKRNVNITELYDENGVKHKWNVFHYGNESYIISKVPGPKIVMLTDVSCSVCGIKKSDIKKLNIDKTIQSVKAMSDINSFYTFYKERCPLGNLHDWINNKCSKCLLTVAMINSVNANNINATVLEYYNQYLSQFIDEKKMISEITPRQPIVTQKIDVQWTYDYTYIVKASKLTNINTNLIEAIGKYEGRNIKDIEEGNNKPETEMYHVYSAYAELLYILSKTSNDTSNDTSISKNYIIYYGALLYDRSYNDTYNYVIQSICEIVIQMNSIDLFHEIINNQKLLSIPIVTFVVDDSDDNIVYLGDDIGDSGEDLIVDQKIADNYASSLNIDYNFKEDNPNNESNFEIPNEYIYT